MLKFNLAKSTEHQTETREQGRRITNNNNTNYHTL